MDSRPDATSLNADNTSLPDMSSSDRPTLILSKGDSSNDSFSCDALGIHYELSNPQSQLRPHRVSTISRWDPGLNRNVTVAEWERYAFKKDVIKSEALGASESVPVNDVLPQTWGLAYDESFDRSFTAPNGKRYTWKSRPLSMKLFRIDSEGSEGTLVAAYHRGRYVIKARKPFIELFDGYEDILDTLIVVTCIIAVSKRKDSEAIAASAAA